MRKGGGGGREGEKRERGREREKRERKKNYNSKTNLEFAYFVGFYSETTDESGCRGG